MVVLTFIAAILLANTRSLYVASQSDSEFNYSLDDGYPIGNKLFGNIAGVDVDKKNNIIIFHRGSHRWEETTFDLNDVYQLSKESPIPEETVITIEPREKKIINAWGRNRFYMPHGLSLDLTGKYLWLTDVALHQVFKYTVDGSREILTLGTPFIPGSDETHFCKPTSVADTGDFVFIADGYCNSRIAMFSPSGKYLGEFGQSSEAAFANTANVQPTFNIPHKITYAKEAQMLCVADRENGRIQCFSFEPKRNEMSQGDSGLLLNGAIRPKFTIADPLFNGLLFSLDYSPIRGGIIVAVSGSSPYRVKRQPPLGFVYNVTSGQLISRFSPPGNRTFGMAHDLAITGDEAGSLYVVDISPVNLWKFSRPIQKHKTSRAAEIRSIAGEGLNRAMLVMRSENKTFGLVWYILVFTILASVLFIVSRVRRIGKSSNSFAALYPDSYPASINSLFGSSIFERRNRSNRNLSLSTMFSRRAFFNLFDRNRAPQSDFNRIPLEESDNSDDDKSDSDVEEFNISQAAPMVNVNV